MWIYKLTNTVNDKVYVGKTVNLRERLQAHARARGAGSLLHLAIKRHGWAAFSCEVLVQGVEDDVELDRLEVYWIAALGGTDRDRGYNLTAGGGGTTGRHPSDATRAAWSEKRKGFQPSALCRQRCAEYSRKPKSEETRRRMSEAAKRRGADPAYRAMMSAATKGIAKAEGHREKLSESARARARTNAGEFA